MTMFSQIARITDHLYLSSAMAVQKDKLFQYEITHVINITVEIPNLSLPDVEFTKIQIDDAPHAHLSTYFNKCSNLIKKVADAGGRTLVHCIAGVSRSSSICIAYLMKHKHMTLKQAFLHVKSRRPVIRPNVGFWKQLIDYEHTIFGNNTVAMIQSGIGWIPDVYEQETKGMIWMGGTHGHAQFGQ